jgi:hypothetical protein
MAQTITITLTVAGPSTGPFNLYSNIDGFLIPFETGISRTALLAGYTSTLVPNGASTVRVTSTGTCYSSVDLSITGITSTTTTSTTSTTTTAAPTTSTTTTTTTFVGTTTTTSTTSTTTTAAPTYNAVYLNYGNTIGDICSVGAQLFYLQAPNISIAHGVTVYIDTSGDKYTGGINYIAQSDMLGGGPLTSTYNYNGLTAVVGSTTGINC